MINTHAEHPLNALEQRLATLVDGLREGLLREQRLTSELDAVSQQRESLQQQLVELEEQLAAATRDRDQLQQDSNEQQQSHAMAQQQCETLQKSCNELEQRYSELDQRWQQAQSRLAEADNQQTRLAELQSLLSEQQLQVTEQQAQAAEQDKVRQIRIAELEVALEQVRVERQQLADQNNELAEENRELDEQNRELEAHNARLRERVEHPEDASNAMPMFARSARRAQGLSALIHHRPRHAAPETERPEQAENGDKGEGGAAEPAQVDQEAADAQQADQQQTDQQQGEHKQVQAQDGVGQRREADSGTSVVASSAPPPVEHDRPESTQGDLPIDKAPSPQALLTEWYQRYDQTFFKGHTRPLKVGIHEDLLALEPWPEKLVRRALACYVNLPRYLKSVREGADRIDLKGDIDGQVDTQAAEHAKRKLDRLQAERQQQGRSNSAPKGVDRHGAGRKSAEKEHGGKTDAMTAPSSSTVSAAEKKPQKPMVKSSRQSASSSSSEVRDQQAESRPEENREVRLQRKLDALMARHNARD
ncbi:ProQ/FINO family protein [Halomonas huangheensis]|uniref:ProQ/FinO domain-containing protein n=1 Tax=Halomonas huangheensis TaxID=1178482 RepID=W1N3V7_9GAMM|nr:ProQ/FINO family protein [Halomonas huangheensis]ALM51698.1 hypothetical protein AR456_04900 [Halomonas huangheensis]ERL50189.1 hypothetical protein BJB45_03420 [Halomonas huangheensis]